MRLIDADALKRKMQKVATEAWKMKLNAPIETTFNQCIDYINSAPTIEPKQGKWTVKNGELAIWDVCSVCGKMVMHKAPFYNYCPNCGADMRRGTNDAD